MVPDEVVIELLNKVAALFPPNVPYALIIAKDNDNISLSGNISSAIPLQGVLALGQIAHAKYIAKKSDPDQPAPSGLVAASASDLSAIDKTVPTPKPILRR